MATQRYIISAGHRNENRGGAAREIEWTYPICVKFKNAIERRGGKAWIIQEEDGDSDRSFSVGRGLQNAAALCVDLAKTIGGADAYLSMHYEGVNNTSVRGFFGIFPDSPQGGVDVRANNPLDYNLIKVMANHVAKIGMPKRTGWVVEPGIMSERQTGVGGDGYRLGEFVGTLGFRDTTARVILEAGAYTNPTDRAMLWDDAWQNKYVEALVDGLEEVYGKFNPGAVAPPKPVPTPTQRTFTTRFELYLRTNPGFWDYEKNQGNITRTLPAGTTGTIISGPKEAEGIDWYDISIPGIGTGWVQNEVLHTLSISAAK